MKRPCLLVLLLAVVPSLACNAVTGRMATPMPESAAWQAAVDAFRGLPTGELPDHLLAQDAALQGDEFDPNDYFRVLQHVTMEPGYVLDFVYRYESLGGQPVLYARRAGEPRFLRLSEYYAARGAGPDRFEWLNHVQADGTPEGYFELVLLRVMGGQFYLWWHADYFDDVIVAHPDRVDEVLAGMQGFCQEMPAASQRQARRLDFAPRVQLQAQTVEVEVVTFSKWGGFYLETFVLQRDFPHEVRDSGYRELVPFDCGVMF
jgi:hypothetical protein